MEHSRYGGLSERRCNVKVRPVQITEEHLHTLW
jgi:hypothetical protein